MTRLVTCGWETGDVAESGVSTIGTNGALTVVASTPTPRGGSYCLKPAATGGGTWASTYKALSLPAAKTEAWVRFAFLAHIPASVETGIATWMDSSTTLQVQLSYNANDGLLRVYRGALSNLLGTSSTSFAQDQWHVIEWREQILTGTTGATEVWLDGNQVITFSGDTSSSVTLNVQSLRLGHQLSGGIAVGAYYLAYDDIAINDTAGSVNTGRPGDGRIVLLSPTGAGSNTALTRGGTDSGANWSQVEELPPAMTDYVFSATAATRDTYALSDLPVTAASISVVEVVTLAQNSDAGAGSLGLTVKSGATTNEGSAQALGTTAAYYRQLYELDPNGSVAWTGSNVNAMEAGVTVR